MDNRLSISGLKVRLNAFKACLAVEYPIYHEESSLTLPVMRPEFVSQMVHQRCGVGEERQSRSFRVALHHAIKDLDCPL